MKWQKSTKNFVFETVQVRKRERDRRRLTLERKRVNAFCCTCWLFESKSKASPFIIVAFPINLLITNWIIFCSLSALSLILVTFSINITNISLHFFRQNQTYLDFSCLNSQNFIKIFSSKIFHSIFFFKEMKKIL